jgi:hypothetical protein
VSLEASASLRLTFSASINSTKPEPGGVVEGEGMGLEDTSEEEVLSTVLLRQIVGIGIPRGLVWRGLVRPAPEGAGNSLIPFSFNVMTLPEVRIERGEDPPPDDVGGDGGGDRFTFISPARSWSSFGLGGGLGS